MDRPDGMSYEDYKALRTQTNRQLKIISKGRVIWQSKREINGMLVKRTYVKTKHGKIGSGA